MAQSRRIAAAVKPGRARSRRWGSPLFWIFSWLLLGLAMALAPGTQFTLLAPAFGALYVYLAFLYLLRLRVGGNVFGEIGFLYLTLVVAYTVLPAFTFMAVDLDFASGWVWEKLSLLLPDTNELGLHLWRHVLMLFGVALGYLLLRKPYAVRCADPAPDRPAKPILLALLGLMILGSVTTVSLLSAPVDSYIDHYTRFDHLSWFALRLVYVVLIFKTSAYYILLTLLFQQYHRYKLIIPFIVLAIASYETVYSFGSRIETLSIILCTVCLYHYKVRAISLQKGALSFIAIATLFSVVELFRSMGFDVADAREAVSTEGAGPASEFGAVFFTGFHLYAERASNAIPPVEWPMFFTDIIALLPFVDHFEWNPQYWYASYYFPDAAVPPQTMGPIADSAIWGGELDLFVRSLVNGMVFAAVMHWYLKRRHLWWATVVYAYLFATSVMTLKYSVFYQAAPLMRIILPGLILVWLVGRFFRIGPGYTPRRMVRTSPLRATPSAALTP